MRVVVTGASRGIGRATALRVGRDGHDVAVLYHDHANEARDVAAAIRAAGAEAFVASGDHGSAAGVGRSVRAIQQLWDRVDGLVLNAGYYPRAPFEKITDAQWQRCLSVNLLGPARIVRGLLPQLRAAPAPSVVFVSSVLAFSGSAHGAHYAAAKAAVGGLAASLARELAPDVRVNSVAPGSIDTAILAGDSPEQRSARARAVPLGRIGTPEEVAAAIAFLLGPDASYLTGSTIHVNGGLRTA